MAGMLSVAFIVLVVGARIGLSYGLRQRRKRDPKASADLSPRGRARWEKASEHPWRFRVSSFVFLTAAVGAELYFRSGMLHRHLVVDVVGGLIVGLGGTAYWDHRILRRFGTPPRTE
jgi:hypothetical protein